MIKSSWAYQNGKRIMKESIKQQKAEKISFIQRPAGKLYAEYGVVKTYSNKKQADKKVEHLRLLGYRVEHSLRWPFTIMLEEIKKQSGHICPYCGETNMQINNHFAHIESEHPEKPLIEF